MPVTVMFPVDTRYLETAMCCLIEELNRLYRWDWLFIGPLCGRFMETNRLVAAIADNYSKDYVVDVKTADVQTYFHLSASWEEQLAGMKKKQRQNVTHAYKVLSANKGPIETTFSDGGNVERHFTEFLEMHQRHWQEGGYAGHFGDWPKSALFHHEVAICQEQYGRLRLMKIKRR